ncbi:hypothetical protein QQ045_026239 [Rhodiola kirilowii]
MVVPARLYLYRSGRRLLAGPGQQRNICNFDAMNDDISKTDLQKHKSSRLRASFDRENILSAQSDRSMGNSQSPASDPRFTVATRAFTGKELEDLKAIFVSLASQSNSEGQFVTPSVFKAYFGLRDPLGGRLFHLVTQKRGDERLTYEDLVIAKGTYEKGTKDEIEEFIFELLDINNDGIVGRSDIEDVVNTTLDDISSSKPPAPTIASHHDNVGMLVNAASFTKHEDGSLENQMTYEDFKSWCHFLPSVRKYLGSLLDAGRASTEVPNLITMENIDSNSILLNKEYAWIIGGCLPQHEMEEWTLLYHSACNGLSFTTFLGNSSDYMGPTVLVIKDKEGYIYGGYASQPWERHGDFYGDMKSFLFELHPKASIFRPTGANNNVQWVSHSSHIGQIKLEDYPLAEKIFSFQGMWLE